MALFAEPPTRHVCPKCFLDTTIKHCKSRQCCWYVCLGLSCANGKQVLVFQDASYFYAARGKK